MARIEISPNKKFDISYTSTVNKWQMDVADLNLSLIVCNKKEEVMLK